MIKLEAFQSTARMSGFANEISCEDGMVLWLKRKISDGKTTLHHRMCIDSLTGSATVYWLSSKGSIDSKVFRSASELEAWIDPKSRQNG